MPTDLSGGLQHPSLFTLAPTQAGGRRALKGFDFQSAYITYVLAGFAAGKEDFVSCRIEAVEDLDALVRVEEIWIERYYQIKSRQEGSGRWTLGMLDREGVLARFFSLFQAYRRLGPTANRGIQLVLVVDGELDGDLTHLRDHQSEASAAGAKMFSFLCAGEAISREPGLRPFANAIKEWSEVNAQLLRSSGGAAGSGSASMDQRFDGLSTCTGTPIGTLKTILFESASVIAPLFGGFLASLRFESRVGASFLNGATFGRLVEAGDLSPEEAGRACDRLRRSIQDESTLQAPTVIDYSILRSWLGVPERTILQSKPARATDTVERKELLEELSEILRTEPFILLYGLSKIGKSQFASALIDHDDREGNYFWYTFLGDPNDLERLIKSLAVWVGEKTGKWQIKDDLERPGLQPIHAFERLRRAVVDGAYVILDDCHKATDATVFGLLRELCGGCLGSRLIMISERKIPTAAAAGAHEIPLGGFSPREAPPCQHE